MIPRFHALTPDSPAELWAGAASVYTQTHPHDPVGGEELRRRDTEQRGWGYGTGVRVVPGGAGPGGGETPVLAMAAWYQNPGAYHPHRYVVELAVRPDWQGRGLGGMLWAELEGALRERGAQAARTLAREDHPLAPGFLARRGFAPGKRYFTSALDVAAFDVQRIAPVLEALAARGLQIRSLADLRAAGVPDLTGRLHALMSDVRQDVPRSDPATPLSREVFEEAVLGDPGLWPQGYLVAQQGEDYVGQTALFRSEAGADLITGLTGVTRAWRGQGVAMGLKLAAIRAARTLGAPTIRTDNASDNAPMLAINDRLGFVRDPASVSWLRAW